MLVFAGCGSYLLVGICAEFVLGAFHPLDADYRFCGTLAPNHQSWNCAFLMIASAGLALTATRGRIVFWGGVVTGLVFLVLTRSRSGFASVVVVGLASAMLAWARGHKAIVISGVGTLVCLVLLLGGKTLMSAAQRGVFLGRVDRADVESLDGRLPLWRECYRYVEKRPVLGYGFNGFWTPDHILDIADQIGWPAPGAHSGYLDLVLGLGIVGGILFVGILLLAMKRCMERCRSTAAGMGPAFFAFLLFFCLVMSMEQIATEACLPAFVVLVILAKLSFVDSGHIDYV
jgi:O-antigen ligase